MSALDLGHIGQDQGLPEESRVRSAIPHDRSPLGSVLFPRGVALDQPEAAEWREKRPQEKPYHLTKCFLSLCLMLNVSVRACVRAYSHPCACACVMGTWGREPLCRLINSEVDRVSVCSLDGKERRRETRPEWGRNAGRRRDGAEISGLGRLATKRRGSQHGSFARSVHLPMGPP